MAVPGQPVSIDLQFRPTFKLVAGDVVLFHLPAFGGIELSDIQLTGSSGPLFSANWTASPAAASAAAATSIKAADPSEPLMLLLQGHDAAAQDYYRLLKTAGLTPWRAPRPGVVCWRAVWWFCGCCRCGLWLLPVLRLRRAMHYGPCGVAAQSQSQCA